MPTASTRSRPPKSAHIRLQDVANSLDAPPGLTPRSWAKSLARPLLEAGLISITSSGGLVASQAVAARYRQDILKAHRAARRHHATQPSPSSLNTAKASDLPSRPRRDTSAAHPLTRLLSEAIQGAPPRFNMRPSIWVQRENLLGGERPDGSRFLLLPNGDVRTNDAGLARYKACLKADGSTPSASPPAPASSAFESKTALREAWYQHCLDENARLHGGDDPKGFRQLLHAWVWEYFPAEKAQISRLSFEEEQALLAQLPSLAASLKALLQCPRYRASKGLPPLSAKPARLS